MAARLAVPGHRAAAAARIAAGRQAAGHIGAAGRGSAALGTAAPAVAWRYRGWRRVVVPRKGAGRIAGRHSAEPPAAERCIAAGCTAADRSVAPQPVAGPPTGRRSAAVPMAALHIVVSAQRRARGASLKTGAVLARNRSRALQHVLPGAKRDAGARLVLTLSPEQRTGVARRAARALARRKSHCRWAIVPGLPACLWGRPAARGPARSPSRRPAVVLSR